MAGKKTNLYEEIGIPKNASKESIKQKFREKAKNTHPDTGGDPDKFRALMHAYDILSDDEKRKRYDIGEDPDVIGREQQPLSIVFAVFNQIVDSNIDLSCNDLFDVIRQSIRRNQQNMREQRSAHLMNIEKYENILKRIKKNGKTELFMRLMEDKIKLCRATIIQIEKDLKLNDDALALILGCEYEFSPKPIVFRYGSYGGTTTSSSW